MDAKEFLHDLQAAASVDQSEELRLKPSGMVDGQFHAMDKTRAEQMRALMHANIDSIFDKLVFDEKGFCVSPISIKQNREHMRLAVGASQHLAFIPTSYTLSITVDETLDQIAERLKKAKEKA